MTVVLSSSCYLRFKIPREILESRVEDEKRSAETCIMTKSESISLKLNHNEGMKERI